jgi:glutaminyl-tRNA synthetase
MYDWAHGQSDAIEGITHSICTLEFENHRPLYDWFLEQLELPHRPQQIEFARLNLTYTVLSKRHLKGLVRDGHVSGWNDPRMPTVSGFRRRGYTPEAIRSFCERIGVAKFNSTVDMVVLENALRDDLNRRAPRRLGVLRPVRLVIENYPEGESEEFEAVNNPEDPSAGTRPVPFSRELWIEADDFREDAPRKWFRLAPGKEVRLRYAGYVTCTGFDKDPATGEVTEVRCTFDPESRGGSTPDGRKVKGTIHWVSAAHAVEAEVRLYDHLFRTPDPGDFPEGGRLTDNLNPDSLEVVRARLEPSLADAAPGERFQLERHGYFCADTVDSRPGAPVFNRSVALRDSWARLEKKLEASGSGA